MKLVYGHNSKVSCYTSWILLLHIIPNKDCDKVLKEAMHALFKSELQLTEAANKDNNSQV